MVKCIDIHLKNASAYQQVNRGSLYHKHTDKNLRIFFLHQLVLSSNLTIK